MDAELTNLIDSVLIEWLSPELKGSIDRLLAAGTPQATIMMAIRDGVHRVGQSPSRSKTVLAVRAYLKARPGAQQVQHEQQTAGAGGGD